MYSSSLPLSSNLRLKDQSSSFSVQSDYLSSVPPLYGMSSIPCATPTHRISQLNGGDISSTSSSDKPSFSSAASSDAVQSAFPSLPFSVDSNRTHGATNPGGFRVVPALSPSHLRESGVVAVRKLFSYLQYLPKVGIRSVFVFVRLLASPHNGHWSKWEPTCLIAQYWFSGSIVAVLAGASHRLEAPKFHSLGERGW